MRSFGVFLVVVCILAVVDGKETFTRVNETMVESMHMEKSSKALAGTKIFKTTYTAGLEQCSWGAMSVWTCGEKAEEDCPTDIVYRWDESDEGVAGTERSVYLKCKWDGLTCVETTPSGEHDAEAFCFLLDFPSPSPTPTISVTPSTTPEPSITPTPTRTRTRDPTPAPSPPNDAFDCTQFASEKYNMPAIGVPGKSIGTVVVKQGETMSIDLADYFCDPDGDELTFRTIGLPGNVQVSGSVISGPALTLGHHQITIIADDHHRHPVWSQSLGENSHFWIDVWNQETMYRF